MLSIYRRFFHGLNASVDYVVWKDCHLLSEQLSGEGDVDLLVSGKQRASFRRLLQQHGFVAARSRLVAFTHVEHYYGVEVATGIFAHLNVYYRLRTGASHTKSYDLPLEERLMQNRVLGQNGVYQASWPDQAMIFAVRHYMKWASPLGLVLWMRERGQYQLEYDHIQSGLASTGHEAVLWHLDSARAHLVFRPQDMELSLGAWLRARTHERTFRGWRHDEAASWLYGVRCSMRVLTNRLLRRRKILNSGVVIAVCGADGSGKSTTVSELSHWFGEIFSVHTLHVGRPPSTVLTWPVRVVLVARRYLTSLGRNGSSGGHVSGSSPRGKCGLISALRFLVLAWERRQVCLRAQRLASEGSIVIADRYVGIDVGNIDSPQIGIGSTGVVGWCGRMEKSLYDGIPAADTAIVLDVELHEAIARNEAREKPDKETAEDIRHRYQRAATQQVTARREVHIDANRGRDLVRSDVFRAAWSTLLGRKHPVSAKASDDIGLC